VNQRLDRITQRAEQQPEEVFNNLYSLLTYDLLEQAFRRLKRDKAPGIDGVTVDQYEANLRVNLLDLETRLHRQSYLATKKVNWISDADIKGFFDHVCHEQLMELLQQRIGDPRMLRLIRRFLEAGVMVAGRREATDE
jgi:hypothetical protein